jgi:hypothetical protein
MKRIKNLKDDDLFLNFDADEIPKTEVKSFRYFSCIIKCVTFCLVYFFSKSGIGVCGVATKKIT